MDDFDLLTPAQRKAKKLKLESIGFTCGRVERFYNEEIEEKRKAKEEKRKAKVLKRKADCLEKITAELRDKFKKQESHFSIYHDDIQHQFESVIFKKGCKICGDTKNVKEQDCGIKTCNDCSGCAICDWVEKNYKPCAGVDSDECHPCCLIIPDRKPTQDYYNLENEPICHACNLDLPESERRLGFSIELEEQMRQKQQALENAQSERLRHFREMSYEQKDQLNQKWRMSQIVLHTYCCKCYQFFYCERVSCQCFSCFMDSFGRYDYDVASSIVQR